MDHKNYWDTRAAEVVKKKKSPFRAFGHAGQSSLYDFYMHWQQKLSIKKALTFSSSGIKKVENVLEIGAGMCRWASVLTRPSYRYVGVDHSFSMLNNAKYFHKKAGATRIPERCVAGGQGLPFKDNTFDVAFTITVLQHIPWKDQLTVMEEMKRVVKPEGIIILLENNVIRRVKKSETEGQHVFPRSVNEWVEMADSLGLESVLIQGEEYAVPLRCMNFIEGWFFHWTKRIKILNLINRGLNFIAALLTIITEPLYKYFLSAKFATHSLIVFKPK